MFEQIAVNVNKAVNEIKKQVDIKEDLFEKCEADYYNKTFVLDYYESQVNFIRKSCYIAGMIAMYQIMMEGFENEQN